MVVHAHMPRSKIAPKGREKIAQHTLAYALLPPLASGSLMPLWSKLFFSPPCFLNFVSSLSSTQAPVEVIHLPLIMVKIPSPICLLIWCKGLIYTFGMGTIFLRFLEGSKQWKSTRLGWQVCLFGMHHWWCLKAI